MGRVNPLTNTIHQSLQSLVQRFSNHLSHRQQSLICFTNLGVQVEGWMKGELLTFLTDEVERKQIFSFDREVKYGEGRKRVDLTISFLGQKPVWIELKHHLIGSQKGISYDAQWYLKDKANGILADVQKLSSLSSFDGYVLILTTANPGSTDWDSAVTIFNNKFEHQVLSLTKPDDFPDTYFLGLLYVVK